MQVVIFKNYFTVQASYLYMSNSSLTFSCKNKSIQVCHTLFFTHSFKKQTVLQLGKCN